MGPTDLPAGLSADNSDCAFLPGEVFTRPPLKRLSTLGTTAQVVYADTFLKPDGTVSQFEATSDGNMYIDGVKIGQTAAGNRFFTCSAFNKLYIATSDGLHGADVPLQYTPEGWLDRVSQDGCAAPPALANLSIAASDIFSIARSGNEVTVVTTSNHNLLRGYLATIANVSPFIQNLTSLLIDNSTLPGVATATVPSPHGFVPGDQVAINDVQPITVGGSITAWNRASGLVTATTATAHNLVQGSTPLVELNTDGFGPVVVLAVLSATVFTFANSGGNGTGTAGSVMQPWGLPDGTLITISGVPSPTTFQFAMDYTTGTWTTGDLSFDWNGAFYVDNIISSTSFSYRQIGPDASGAGGMVTPTGQLSPGNHTCVVVFRTRTGALLTPSPPVTLTASGGQYLTVSNIPLGPSNVTERWLAFTGANGGKYFILPIAPRDPSGQFPIGTATAVPDNTTTSVILDFTDEALFDGIAIDIPGNNLFRQQVIGPVLGFFQYGSRLFSWGERNKIQQFLNMGFEGGIYSGSPNTPLGWTVTGSDGVLTAGDYGLAWQATTATISQPAYQDQNGVAIIQPNTQYTYRAWVDGTSQATLSSASTGFVATATVTASGAFGQANFSWIIPSVIPPDLTLTLSQTVTTTVDEVEIIYTNNPYILTASGSYVNNPQAKDGVTCILGPQGDPHPVFGMEERKDVLCLLTSGPEGSLYETEQTASGEPVTWDVRHIASKCGLVSVWGVAKFEDWFSWISDTGMRIFDGSVVEKMSQEIQPWWDSINPQAKQFAVLANDPDTRRVYISAPINSSMVTNSMYVMDYNELNTSSLLANAGTLRIGYSGKTITTDLTRKWSPWSVQANYCGLLTLPNGSSVMAFCGGRGNSLQTPWFSTVYTLEEGTINGLDDDYGPFWQNSTYPTYFFISADDAKANQLGTHRLLHAFATLNCTGAGSVFLVPNLDRMGNTGTPTRALTVTPDLARDLEFGLNVAAERISYRISCQPAGAQPAPSDSPAGFRLSSMVVAVKTHPYSPIRGKNS
jgi:hypothetical protein